MGCKLIPPGVAPSITEIQHQGHIAQRKRHRIQKPASECSSHSMTTISQSDGIVYIVGLEPTAPRV